MGEEKLREELDDTWNYYQHADTLHSERSNYFLVLETVLIAVYAQVLVDKPYSELQELFLVIIPFLGALTTIIWWMVNYRLSLRLQAMDCILKRLDKSLTKNRPYKHYIKATKNLITSGTLLTDFLPGGVLVVWIILFIASIWIFSQVSKTPDFQILGVGLVVGFSIIVTVIVSFGVRQLATPKNKSN